MPDRDPTDEKPRTDASEPADASKPADAKDGAAAPERARRGSPPKWDPGPSASSNDPPPRQSRRVYGRDYRLRTSSGQQFIFIGLALLFLVGYFVFRQSCASRVARTYDAVTDQSRKDAGTARKRPGPRPDKPSMRALTMRPIADPDDW